MSVQAWFRSDQLAVRPGETASLSLAVENVSDTTQTYTIVGAGLAASWVHITRTSITVFGGSTDLVEVSVSPPAIASTSAGPTAIAVRVTPQANPDDAVVAETVLDVEHFDDRRISLLRPLQRARRRATFEFLIENHGNSLANCRLHLVDPTDRVDGEFDPPAVGVAPGDTSLVRLNARAKRGGFRRRSRQLDLQIDATEPDHAPAIGKATIIQPPTIPLRSLSRVVGVIALAGLVWAGWHFVAEPAIEDAVDDAVTERLENGAISSGVNSDTSDDAPDDDNSNSDDEAMPVDDDSATDGSSAALAESGDAGDPVAYRISVEVGVTQERSQSILVPPDSNFELTDIVLQNPGGDDGSARLLRNDQELYEWDLGEMTAANEFQARVTPLPFEAGDSIVLQVQCDAVGDPTGTGCDVSVLITGRLVDA